MKQKQQAKAKKIRVAIYARARSLDQKGEDLQTKREDLESQLQKCREVAQKCGWEIIGEYADFQTRGNNGKPQLEELANRAAQKGDFDKVLVFTLDRIGRKLWYYQTMLDHFKQHGATVESTRDNYHRLVSLIPLIF